MKPEGISIPVSSVTELFILDLSPMFLSLKKEDPDLQLPTRQDLAPAGRRLRVCFAVEWISTRCWTNGINFQIHEIKASLFVLYLLCFYLLVVCNKCMNGTTLYTRHASAP